MAVIFGLYHGITITVQRTMVSKYVSEQLRGTAFGVYYLFAGMSFFVANLTFGFLWDLLGSQVAFGYSIITTVTAFILLTMFTIKTRQIVNIK